jgi:tetratricopeptide (TPR) repeat protein
MKYLLPILFAFCFFSCQRHSDNWEKICDVENYIESRPDSALAVLEAIDIEKLSSDEEKAKYALYMSMALDKNYIDKTDFDVLQPAIDYYENHGSATDKLRTFYYQGRVFYNRGEIEDAMECLIKSIDLGKTSSDLLTKARNYTVQGTLYYLYYNWNKIIECSLAACDCYKTIGDIDNYVIMLCRVAEVNTLMGNKELGRDYLLRCQDLLDGINNNSKAYYYRVCLSNDSYELPSETIPQNIVEYLSLVSLDDADWLTVAGAYLRIHDITSAKDAISKYQYNGNDARYYAFLTDLYKVENSYKEALSAYENFNQITDSLDFIALEQDTQFIEERHRLEMATIKEQEKKKQIIAVFATIVSILILVAIWITSRLRLSRMEKLVAEKETERYKLLYAQMEDERDNLNALLQQNEELDPKAMNAVARRLELLNKFFTAYITDNSDIDRKASKEMEDLLEDKEKFMDSNRLAYAGSHPKFIKYLEDKGLTEWEINYCCLYALGLKGKEVGAYIKMRSHYNNSSEVREKLGITEHDTNLGIYIRKLVKSLSE